MGNSNTRRSGEYSSEMTESTRADSHQLTTTYGGAGNAEGDGATVVAIRPVPDDTADAGEIDVDNEDENENRTLEQDMTPKERRRATAILW